MHAEQTTPTVNVGGRPTEYKKEYNDQAYKLALLGATDGELSDFFDVSEQTINAWKHKHPKFLESIREGKIKADSNVAHKLYDKAIGAQWVEDEAFKVKRVDYENGKKVREFEEVITVPVRKSAPPDTPAISLWLRNRKSDKWKDKGEENTSDKLVIQIMQFGKAHDIRTLTEASAIENGVTILPRQVKESSQGQGAETSPNEES